MKTTHPQLPVISLLLLLVALLPASPLSADQHPYPLEPVDTSSPRATLASFISDADAVFEILGGEYRHSPSYSEHSRASALVVNALRTLDLSQTSPTTRVEIGYDGALTSIPNERMASLNIENIGRRQFIRRQTNLRLAYDTPPDKIETALAIIEDVLKDHEGMQPELPPRVFFDEFNTDSLNLFISYWYHPPKRWQSLAYDQQVNMQIMRRFDAEGIHLALPSSTMRWIQENGQANTSPPLGDKA